MTDERITAALDTELERRAGRGDSAVPTVPLSPDEQAEVNSLLDVADLLWESADAGAPPLEEDPTALMLGLVPAPSGTWTMAAFKQYRLRAGLKQSELATRLAERGWDVATKDVFAWETKSVTGLAPALVRAIADELGIEVELLMRRQQVAQDTVIDQVSRTQWFIDLCQTWANSLEITFSSARTALLTQMSVTANRGSDLTEEQWRDVLEQLPPHAPGQSSGRRP